MYEGRTVFSQTLDFLSRKSFRRCVQRYGGNYRIRSFTCYEQFLCMAFAQLTYRDSLRDTVLCLRALQKNCIMRAFNPKSLAVPWLMPTKTGTGAFTAILPRFS